MLFETQAKEFGKQAGVEIAIERINQNDIQARVTAAIQSGAGPDIIVLANNHPQLYEASLVDVSDVAEEIGAQAGRLVRLRQGQQLRGRAMDRRAAVHHLVGDHLSRGLAQGGGLRVSEDLGRLPQGRPRHEGQGQARSARPSVTASTIPTPGATRCVWMWGGIEVAADGRTVVLNSKNTVEVVKFNTMLWKECFDEGGLAWDDSNNNRAFLSRRSR